MYLGRADMLCPLTMSAFVPGSDKRVAAHREKSRTVNFPEAAGNWIADAHGGKTRRGGHEEPDRLARVSQEARCASGRVAQTRSRFFARGPGRLRAARLAEPLYDSESHTAVVSRAGAAVAAATVLPFAMGGECTSSKTFSCSGRGNCRPPCAAASTASRPLREYPPRC
jgi:hypothetical protein